MTNRIPTSPAEDGIPNAQTYLHWAADCLPSRQFNNARRLIKAAEDWIGLAENGLGATDGDK